MTSFGCEERFARSLGVSRLVRPSDVDTFLHDVWAKATRSYPQSLGEKADDVLTIEAFELILGTLNRAHEGWLHFARGGLKQVPRDMMDDEGMLDLRKIRAAFSSGETLYLTKAERLTSSLMYLCRNVELDLLARGILQRKSVNAHVFLTPPGSQGFPTHRDEHASFILQLEGSKAWTIYEPRVESTVESRGVLRPGIVDSSSLRFEKMYTFTLQAGDVLYMPEWWPHEAKTSSSHSLHVTLRIFPLRWVDLLLELCADHPALSESVPRDAATEPREIVEPLVGVLTSQEFLQPLPSLLEEIARHHAVPRTVLPDDGFRQALTIDQVSLDTLLVRPAGTSCTVFESGEHVCIGFPGGVIRGPSLVRKVFEYVVHTTAFRPGDLPPIVGGDYDRLEVARMMVRDGLLRIADHPCDDATGPLHTDRATSAISNVERAG